MNRASVISIVFISAFLFGTSQAAEDIVISDFEGKDYGQWQTKGEAFATAPAQGTLSHQGPVSRYKGKGLVNSFYKGDATTGTLTSPEFTIKRKYITLLIGGGRHPGDACINLMVDGKVVRSCTGPDDERLREAGFDVSALAGKKAKLQIIDRVQGNWGHVCVDHIVQTDSKPDFQLKTEPPAASELPLSRDITINKRYLLFPISGTPQCNVVISAAGKSIRIFDASLATQRENIRFWSIIDMSAYRGQKVNIRVKNLPDEAFGLIHQGDSIPGEEKGQSQTR